MSWNLLNRYRPIVPDWEDFLEALRRPLPRSLWANPLRTDPHALRARLESQGLKPKPVAWDATAFTLPAEFEPGIRWEYVAGLYHPQESVSLIPALLLDPKPGERVLDLCA